MSEALTIRNDSSLEELASRHGVSVQVAAAILNEQQNLKDMQDVTKARARLAFHGKGISKLIEIAEGGDPKQALSAISLLGKLAGEFKAPRPVMMTFDDLMKKAATASAGPLGGITQIAEATVIDAEDESDDDYSE